MAQGCTLSPTLFSSYINGLLCEIEKCPELGINFSENTLAGLQFANEFVGFAEIGSALQNLLILYIIIVNVNVLKPMQKSVLL